MIFAVMNFVANLSITLVGPLILSIYTVIIFSFVDMSIGISNILGSIIASILPMPNKDNKIKYMFTLIMLASIGLFLSGISIEWFIIAGGICLFMFPMPYANCIFVSIIQTKIELNMQGRVYSLLNAILRSVSPLAYILAGPLADSIFGPLMKENGFLSSTIIGDLLGYGKERGIGIIFIICGLSLFSISIVAFLNKNITSIDSKIPDVN